MSDLPLPENTGNRKSRLREEALQRRMTLPMDAISPQIRDVLCGWTGFKEAARVLIYAPFRNEVDLLSMTADYPKKQWFLPAIGDNDEMRFLRYQHGEALKPGRYGISEPVGDVPMLEVMTSGDLILIPGLLFDRQGYRLGYGKGYYDRFLSAAPGFRVGIAPSALVADALPHETWDVRMHYLACEQGMLETD